MVSEPGLAARVAVSSAPVVAVDVGAHLEVVAVVGLTAGAGIEAGIFLEGPRLVDVGQVDELRPVLIGERHVRAGPARSVIGGAVAGEDATAQEVLGRFVRHVLEVAVGEALVDARLEGVGQSLDIEDFHYALQAMPRLQPQAYGRNYTEEPVSADGRAEQVRVG